MDLFSEIYSTYYLTVRKILELSLSKSFLTADDIKKTIDEYAFSESPFFIIPNLDNGSWSFFDKNENYTPKLSRKNYEIPVTYLQKSWIKAILCDKRIALFLDEAEIFEINQKLHDVEKLFDINNFHIFDKNHCGDDFDDSEYIKNFRAVLNGIKNKDLLEITYKNKNGLISAALYIPKQLNYSAKDDKFRLTAYRRFNKRYNHVTLNLSSIISVKPSEISANVFEAQKNTKASIVIKLFNKRNALERFLLQFAQYEKETAIQDEGTLYLSKIFYNPEDCTELIIRILSFGPVLKVIAPDNFVTELKERIKKQIEIFE